LGAAANAQQGAVMTSPAPIVFFDIAGPDTTALAKFYGAVFGWRIGADGRFDIPVVSASLSATLRKDPVNKIVYLGVPDIAAALKAVTENGGKVVMPRFEVKGTVVIGLFTDPAGNSMGLVEMAGDKPKIP
jgi:predicted enzyme related to lactoylglutathione lyase